MMRAPSRKPSGRRARSHVALYHDLRRTSITPAAEGLFAGRDFDCIPKASAKTIFPPRGTTRVLVHNRPTTSFFVWWGIKRRSAPQGGERPNAVYAGGLQAIQRRRSVRCRTEHSRGHGLLRVPAESIRRQPGTRPGGIQLRPNPGDGAQGPSPPIKETRNYVKRVLEFYQREESPAGPSDRKSWGRRTADDNGGGIIESQMFRKELATRKRAPRPKKSALAPPGHP